VRLLFSVLTAARSRARGSLRSSTGESFARFPEGTYLFESYNGQHFHQEYTSREIARAARRVLSRSVSGGLKAVEALGRSDHAALLLQVRDAFSDEELFGGM